MGVVVSSLPTVRGMTNRNHLISRERQQGFPLTITQGTHRGRRGLSRPDFIAASYFERIRAT